jgi:nucleoside-diphosphate-sugar epimerase
MKKILVTGGLGFIGSHLINELNNTDCEIDIVDNLSNNCLTIEQVKLNKVKEIKICKFEDFNLNKKYDEIYHLASPVGPAGVLNYAGIMGRIILDDALKVAEYASKNGSKVIFVSTSEIYGKDPGKEAQSEDIFKVVPSKITVRLEYGVGKLLMEICVTNYSKYHPLKFNFIRPFNIIGVGQSAKAGFVIPRFVWQALHNEDITVFGDGSQLRTFTHVKDIVDAMILCMNSNISGEAFNVGNPKNILSILRVAEKIKELTHSKSKIICIDPKTIYGKNYEEAWNKIPDITKISSSLGWKPKYSVEEVLNEIIKDYKLMIQKGEKPINQE